MANFMISRFPPPPLGENVDISLLRACAHVVGLDNLYTQGNVSRAGPIGILKVGEMHRCFICRIYSGKERLY